MGHFDRLNCRNANKNPNQKGFTLVELIVSMAIAGVLMVGLSTFFASTFHNLFQAQAENANTERQYAINQILEDKMETVKALVDPLVAGKIFTFNQSKGSQLPFTFISTVKACPSNSLLANGGACEDQDKNPVEKITVLAFKDMLPFSKIVKIDATSYAYGDSGNGIIRNALNGNAILDLKIKNFAGFTKMGDEFYVADPGTHKILKCVTSGGAEPCSPLDLGKGNIELSLPMDVETDGSNLYVSDSGNNRIIKLKISAGGNSAQVIAANLNFPIGLGYYKEGTNNYLFAALALDNKVVRIGLDALGAKPVIEVVGEGENGTCAGTARFCALNMPTGLFLDSVNNALYIADSGNNRVLKMTDPGRPNSLVFKFKLDQGYALDRIELKDGNWSGGKYNDYRSNPVDPVIHPDESNLVGTESNYDSEHQTFSNPKFLTVFSNGTCVLGGTNLFVEEDLSSIPLRKGDRIKVKNNGALCTIASISSEDCNPDPLINLTRYKISTTAACATSAGWILNFSNPTNAIMKIDTPPPIVWGQNGFQTTQIDTFDLYAGLAETDYQAFRVGDGVLGTEEDVIKVIAKDDWVLDELGATHTIAGNKLAFPTGVSNAYLANTIGKNVVKRSDGLSISGPTVFKPVDTSFGNEDYDYVSDFALDEATPIEFSLLNDDPVKKSAFLQLKIKTALDPNGNQQTYTHDALISR